MKHRGRSVAGRLRAGGRNGGARPAARSGSAAVAGQPRSRTEGRRGGPLGRRPQQGCRSARRTEARGGGIGAGGTALEVAFSREALHLPWPSRRRPQRGCSSAHDNTFAGGQSASSSEAPAFLCQTGLRLSGHCGPGWRWTAGSGSVAVPRRGAGRWGAHVGSIPLPWTMDRACLLPRPEDGCLLAFTFRSAAAGGRAVCRLSRRAVPGSAFGLDEAGCGIPVGAGRVMPMDQGDRRHTLGYQAAGGRASGLVLGGQSDVGRMGRWPSNRFLLSGGRTGAAAGSGGRPEAGFWSEAAGEGHLSRRPQRGGGAALGSDAKQEGVQRAGGRSGGAAAGKRLRLRRRHVGRRRGAGGLRGVAQVPADRRAATQQGRRRQRGSGVRPRTRTQHRRRPGRSVSANPFSASLPNTTEVERGAALGGARAVGLSGN